jgi:hypothetical protein
LAEACGLAARREYAKAAERFEKACRADGARFVVELPLGPGIGERIQEIGLRPDLSDDIGLLSARGGDISFQPAGGG